MNTPYQAPSSELDESGLTKCRGCGHDVHTSASACPNCGLSRRRSRYKNKYVAAILAFFLGGFGVHRFYLGQWWGVFYLLFFWAWIPGLIAFIEFIYFLVCNSDKWDQKYNEGMPAGPGDKSSGVLIAILAIFGIFVFIAVLGIIAAVTLPAYQDYTVRAKVAESMVQVAPIKSDVEAYYAAEGRLPSSNTELNLDDPVTLANGSTVAIADDGVVMTFGPDSTIIESKTLVFTPEEGNPIAWQCFGGTLENKYRPSKCRN